MNKGFSTYYIYRRMQNNGDKTSKEVNAILEQFSSTAFLGLKSSLLSEKDRLIDDKQNIDK